MREYYLEFAKIHQTELLNAAKAQTTAPGNQEWPTFQKRHRGLFISSSRGHLDLAPPKTESKE
jgi:hypothetical protein